ncbi:MAG: DsbC family protein [Burkholderiaceae bacterium]|nr:MAG: DsbC family protein [Burkholderiaceae bacterium]
MSVTFSRAGRLARLTTAVLLTAWLTTACDKAPRQGGGSSPAPLPGASVSSGAATPLVDPGVEARLRQMVLENLPQLGAPRSIRPAPMPGWYELSFDERVLYADGEGRHVLKGEWIDTQTGRNHTQERLDQIQRVDFSALPLQHAVVMKRGKGTRRLVVFADPLCSYCKKLEQSLGELDDVTIYTFIIPILDERSVTLGQHVLCAPVPLVAWRRWMLEGHPPPEGACDSPLRKLADLGQQLRVRVTPTLVFEDGMRVRGALDIPEIRARLSEAAQRRPAAEQGLKPSP